jgi:hypothetical protein
MKTIKERLVAQATELANGPSGVESWVIIVVDQIESVLYMHDGSLLSLVGALEVTKAALIMDEDEDEGEDEYADEVDRG